MRALSTIMIAAVLMGSCKRNEAVSDASGSFEAEETIISAEATGLLKTLNIEEGMSLDAGQYIGYIDSTQAYLRKRQLQAQAGAVQSRRPNVQAQLAALQVQLAAAQKEARRMSNLVKADAATPKQ